MVTGNTPKAEELTRQALTGGMMSTEITINQRIPAMSDEGGRSVLHELFIPELLLRTRHAVHEEHEGIGESRRSAGSRQGNHGGAPATQGNAGGIGGEGTHPTPTQSPER